VIFHIHLQGLSSFSMWQHYFICKVQKASWNQETSSASKGKKLD